MKLLTKHNALLAEASRRGSGQVAQLRLTMQLLTLTAAIEGDCSARLAPARLSEGKFVLLFLLDGQIDGLSPHQLAERAGVTPSTITGLLDGLERDGYLARHRGLEDRRKISIRLSTKGQDAATQLFELHTQWISTLFDGLDGADQAAFGQLLEKVWRNTDAGKAAK